MNNENLKRVFDELAATCTYLFRQALGSQAGINKKVGKNTLTGEIYRTVRSEANVDNAVISLIMKGYIDYIESGMRKGVWVPIRVLASWATSHNISSDNSTLYAIQRSIFNVGIPARPISDKFWDDLDKIWEEWADKIFNAILEDYK